MVRILCSLFSLVALVGAPACSGGGEDGADAGPGEGEGEVELVVIDAVFERDGAALEDGVLDVGTHDPAAGPLLVDLALRNRGDEPFELLSEPPLLIAGADASQFTIPTQVEDIVIEPDEAAPFVLAYAPTATGPHEATLLFAFGVETEERMMLQLRGVSGGAVEQAGVNYAIYDGNFVLVPDFSTLTPVETGVVPTFDITPRATTPETGDFFAFRFTGEIEIATAGAYTFFTTSDDGSQLWIDGALVVDNDGLHGSVTAPGDVTLTAGRHAIEVGYFEGNGGAVLNVEWQGPGVDRATIPAAVLFH